MATHLRPIIAGVLTLAVFLSSPPRALSQEQGNLFGDLFEIKRDAATGQPILQKRWAERPGDEFGWDYCPIPVDAAGAEIPFAPLSCEVDPAEMHRVIEIDYFGRLNASRTRESNQRMHFNEVISNIKAAEIVTVDEAGRVKLGTGCDPGGVCAEWSTIDSPMENMSLYNRLLKYGHIQTDPLEEDTSTGGDPNEGTRYYPALGPGDWAKFRGQLVNLLPRAHSNQCFTGPAPGTFVPACAAPQALVAPDFIVASSFLGGAASKHNLITIDVIQYLNRFLKITTATAETPAPVATLPALVRDEFGVIAPARTACRSPRASASWTTRPPATSAPTGTTPRRSCCRRATAA